MALVTVLVLLSASPASRRLRLPRTCAPSSTATKGLNKITGGRVYLIQAGGRMFEKHPLAGVGLASFPLAFPTYRASRTGSVSPCATATRRW